MRNATHKTPVALADSIFMHQYVFLRFLSGEQPVFRL